MNFGICLVALALVSSCRAERWRWPEEAESVRIDSKVRFLEPAEHKDRYKDHFIPEESRQQYRDSAPDSKDFLRDYVRRGEGRRYPVHVHDNDDRRNYNRQDFDSDGTLDSLEYCKCVSTPDCTPRNGLPNACGFGKYLCCYKRPNKQQQSINSLFNDVNEDRLFNQQRPVLVGPEGPTGYIGPVNPKQEVLVGPSGPTGLIGPQTIPQNNQGVLVGPGGPTGHIGPQDNRDILVGPGGPTGVIGPSENGDVLVGPGGPTGIIGPGRDVTGPEAHAEPTAQRGILVGPGGPTGVIGPGAYGRRRPVLVGPSGPTGIIGPGYGGGRRGVLVGPGGPTGIIGPGGYGFSRGRPGGMFFGSGYGR